MNIFILYLIKQSSLIQINQKIYFHTRDEILLPILIIINYNSYTNMLIKKLI